MIKIRMQQTAFYHLLHQICWRKRKSTTTTTAMFSLTRSVSYLHSRDLQLTNQAHRSTNVQTKLGPCDNISLISNPAGRYSFYHKANVCKHDPAANPTPHSSFNSRIFLLILSLVLRLLAHPVRSLRGVSNALKI